MSKELLAHWPEWRDNLVLALRMKDVPGKEIGEILVETAAHLDETGETPEDAFGDPVLYAQQRTLPGTGVAPTPEKWWRSAGIGLVSFVGGVMAAGAAWALGTGDMQWGSLPTVVALLVGIVLLFGPLWLIKGDPIVDPRTGANAYGDGAKPMLWMTGAGLVFLALLASVSGFVG